MHTIAAFQIAGSDIGSVAGGVQLLTPAAFCRLLGPNCAWYPIEIPVPFIPFVVFN
jgi:hypothetical protein